MSKSSGRHKPVNNDSIELEDASPADDAHAEWKDVPFGAAWCISLAMMLVLGVYLLMSIDDDVPSTEGTEPASSESGQSDLSFDLDMLEIVGGVTAAIMFTFLWLALLIYFASCIIKTILILSVVAMVAMAILSFASGSMFGGIICLLFAALRAWYAWAVWDRVPFATACLELSIKVLQEFWSPIFINLGIGIASWVVIGIDSLVLYAVTHKFADASLAGFLLFLLLIVYYWHMIVCFNVAHVTSCGVAGTYLVNKEQMDGAVGRSLKISMTTSFGSICFGALVEAVLRAIEAMIRNAERNNRGDAVCMAILCILRCIIQCIGDIVEYINSYAFVYVALYGESYMNSVRAVFKVAKSKGMTALINDNLTNIPLYCGAIFVLLLTVLVCWAIGGWSLNIFISAMCGLVLYMCVVHTLVSYIKTLFIVWITDPAAFKEQRPEEFAKIMETATRDCGYDCQWAEGQQRAV